jgi:hypothetical protein
MYVKNSITKIITFFRTGRFEINSVTLGKLPTSAYVQELCKKKKALKQNIMEEEDSESNMLKSGKYKAKIPNTTNNAYFYNDKTTKNNKLFSISYDNTKNHNVKISCEGVCNKSSSDSGVVKNNIEIPYYDYKEQKIDTSCTKTCYCDKDYIGSSVNYSKLSDLGVDGDEFLADYYKGFYNNNQSIHSYDGKLYFPV